MTKPVSLHDFKNWLSKQPDMSEFFSIGASQEDDDDDRKYEKYIGREVVAKMSHQKLIEKVESDGVDSELLIDEFMETGGTVSDVEGGNVVIETESGTFTLPRFCVTPRK